MEREILKTLMGSQTIWWYHCMGNRPLRVREAPLKAGKVLSLHLHNLCNQQCPVSGPMRTYLSITIICTIRLLLYATVPIRGPSIPLQYIKSMKLFVTVGS